MRTRLRPIQAKQPYSDIRRRQPASRCRRRGLQAAAEPRSEPPATGETVAAERPGTQPRQQARAAAAEQIPGRAPTLKQ